MNGTVSPATAARSGSSDSDNTNGVTQAKNNQQRMEPQLVILFAWLLRGSPAMSQQERAALSQLTGGAPAGSVKVSPYDEFPAKGRATGGVRCHRFLKGEDTLILAWAGPGPALGATEAGGPVELPGAFGRRDGSGVGLAQPLAAVGGTATLSTDAAVPPA